jgi:chorismate mutase
METRPQVCRGVRGATTAPADTAEAIHAATRELLLEIVAANEIDPEDIASILFTMSPDLRADYPAAGARQLGWMSVPLLCAQEIDAPEALPRTIRVLVHWNTSVAQKDICHVYINGAEVLRPDQAMNTVLNARSGNGREAGQ